MKEDEMARVCSTYRVTEECIYRSNRESSRRSPSDTVRRWDYNINMELRETE
jgi:hypothetical protein